MTDTVLSVRGVEVGHGDEALLEDVSFDVQRGEVFVILGGSGVGKSTLLRHLIGLQRPRTGTVTLDGEEQTVIEHGRPSFGVLFQSGALLGSSTLGENVALPLETWTRLSDGDIASIVRSKLRLVGLEGFENHLPSAISGGMRKRGGIARALALEPRLLFLDEPSGGLDPITSAELDELLLTLNRTLGVTLVVVSHHLASIFRIATSCILLDREARGIIATGDPRELRDQSEDPRVRAFLNGDDEAPADDARRRT